MKNMTKEEAKHELEIMFWHLDEMDALGHDTSAVWAKIDALREVIRKEA